MDDVTALLCNICPKRPTFSDVSHLLTHVASKAHLSHYFKLQVRSHQEHEAATLLEEYDQWYKSKNLAKLLADRMSSKDARKKKGHGKPAAQTKAVSRRKVAQPKVPPATANSTESSSHVYFPACLDPRLASSRLSVGPGVEYDDFSVFATYTSLITNSTSDTRPQPGLDSAMFTMDTEQACASVVPKQLKEENGLDSDDEGLSPLKYPPFSPLETSGNVPSHLSQTHSSYDPFIDADEIDRERSEEISRLKGVLWPGMDIFDSATEQMRRKRNQKKDESILKKMEKTSLCVEPTELVFSPTGVLRKQRVISGNVDDSSPLKGETPIQRRRTNRPKRVLTQADSNILRARDRKWSQKRRKTGLSRRDDSLSRSGLPFQELSHFGNAPHTDDVDEFVLAFRENDFRPHSGLSIFRDHSDSRSSSMRDPFDRHGPLLGDSNTMNPHHLQQDTNPLLSTARHALDVSANKENIEPLLNIGRTGPPFDWDSPLAMPLPNNMAYPPKCFFHDPPHIGLNPFERHDSPTSYSQNPLVGSFGKLSSEENPAYTPDLNSRFVADPMLHPASPDATISDIGDDALERLYLDGSSY
ncbi:hypothetical protein BJX96DRAFT_176385 [Aspergillus floccosus]